MEEILTQSQSRESLGKVCRILEGNEVSWFVNWYHSLHCLSISKGPWLSEFLMAPLSSCAAFIVEQKPSYMNTGINCREYKLANRFIPHTDITNEYWWLPAVQCILIHWCTTHSWLLHFLSNASKQVIHPPRLKILVC